MAPGSRLDGVSWQGGGERLASFGHEQQLVRLAEIAYFGTAEYEADYAS